MHSDNSGPLKACFFFVFFFHNCAIIPTMHKMELVEFANSVDPDEFTPDECHHLDEHFLPSVFEFSI